MILLDYSGVAMAALFSQGTDNMNEEIIRHLILNSIRMYNVKYRKEYGQMVLCCDGGNNWRRSIYSQYKQKRRDSRDATESTVDWKEFFRILNVVRDEIREFIPWKVIHVDGAEADDIVSTICRDTQDFGRHDDIMIISSDHDFIQLQTYDNVSQFSPATKKLISESNPHKYAFEQLLRGCGGDGVPNILSADDVFLSGGRQTSLSSKKVESLWESKKSGTLDSALTQLSETAAVNFQRNTAMIDLLEQKSLPRDIQTNILVMSSNPPAQAGKAFNYLIQKRCRMLIPAVSEFFPVPQ